MARPVTEFTSSEWWAKLNTNREGRPLASKKVVSVPLKKSTKLSWKVPQSMTPGDSRGGNVSRSGGLNDAARAPAGAETTPTSTADKAKTAHATRFISIVSSLGPVCGAQRHRLRRSRSPGE